MGYVIRNIDNRPILFSIVNDFDRIEGLTIPIGGYLVGNTLLENQFTSIQYGKNKLISDLFDSVKKGYLTIKDDAGNDVTYAQYLQDHPEAGASISASGINDLPTPSITGIIVQSNITLAIDTTYLIDTSAARTLTLPALSTQNISHFVGIVDLNGLANTNNITVKPAGSDVIKGVTGNLVIDVNNANLKITSTSTGWNVTNAT